MTVAIKRSTEASELAGISSGEAYEVQGYTDGNAIIINDDGSFVAVPYGLIGDDQDWSIARARYGEQDKAVSAPSYRPSLVQDYTPPVSEGAAEGGDSTESGTQTEGTTS